jgi:hypothetical protein
VRTITVQYRHSMSVHHLIVECNDPVVMGDFWAGVLRLAHKGDGVLFSPLAGSRKEISISFAAVGHKIRQQGFHFRLSPDSGSVESEVRRIQELGGTLVGKRYKGWGIGEVTMQDPEANVFFVESGHHDLEQYETSTTWESGDPFWADAVFDRPQPTTSTATAGAARP